MAGKQQKTDVQDPVCGMTVDRTTAEKETWKNQDYFFCSEGCRRKFRESPETYTSKKQEVHRA